MDNFYISETEINFQKFYPNMLTILFINSIVSVSLGGLQGFKIFLIHCLSCLSPLNNCSHEAFIEGLTYCNRCTST